MRIYVCNILMVILIIKRLTLFILENAVFHTCLVFYRDSNFLRTYDENSIYNLFINNISGFSCGSQYMQILCRPNFSSRYV
jgi:hypothetical protein